MFNRMPKIVGSRDLGHAHFQGKLFVRPLAFLIQNCIPNLKSLAQLVFEILRSSLSVFGSRVWFFKVTWRRQSR